MFSSAILDVAVGVIFCFLAVSLFTSAAVEAINSVFKLRSRSLVSGIKQLVNDPAFTGLAKTLYQHAAISPRGPGGNAPLKNFPAYVDGMQFAGALLDITGLSAASATAAALAPGPLALAALKAQLTVNDPQLKQLIDGIVDRSAGDIKLVKSELASWFDVGMDRLSGDFKRWTQLATFVIALLVAALCNMDSVRLAMRLWEQPTLADRLKAPPQPPGTAGVDLSAQEEANFVLTTIIQADLPVGWAPGHFLEVNDGHDHWSKLWASSVFFSSLSGWIITAVAALFGAPFWFDTLQSVVRLKGSGPSPAEKKNNQAAAN